jgi:hypothetical protein
MTPQHASLFQKVNHIRQVSLSSGHPPAFIVGSLWPSVEAKLRSRAAFSAIDYAQIHVPWTARARPPRTRSPGQEGVRRTMLPANRHRKAAARTGRMTREPFPIEPIEARRTSAPTSAGTNVAERARAADPRPDKPVALIHVGTVHSRRPILMHPCEDRAR